MNDSSHASPARPRRSIPSASTDQDAAAASSLHEDGPAARPFAPLELETTTATGSSDDDNDLAPLVGNESNHHHTDSKSFVDDGHGGPPPGSATTPQVIINIVISFVGAGLLGIPNAFSQSGWLLGSLTLLTVSALNVYAMLCLPVVQVKLQQQFSEETIQSYGDLGRVILGDRGEKAIFVCLGISQAGFATAYLIFIAANLNSIYDVSRGVVCMACIPGLALLDYES
ncbi:MAG: hypothetical protein SGARI_004279 [Bacillariaceae sp.]